ncbi:class I SAM-dependent methyltransferase [Pelagicoccus sp. SDUM812003]|uniref:class I SAM-dependent methyltransferase n=1 Tax=Pelagicoccus sp. SDUM812003 TaxID=3041267 RepID=UPI00280EDB2E|nr:class I SAM-dependent methyltransferase [Pelagicoccus sp. SDUM812003]MDQ8203602.1 class I SAM-dependent methyltransferase [Pelagicoccus sp. SDUM812003]
MSLISKIETASAISRGFICMTGYTVASPFHRPSRLRFLEAARERFSVYLREPTLERVAVSELVDTVEEIVLRHSIAGEWQVTLPELAVLVGIAKSRSVSNIFEIGTFDGRTSLNLSLNSPSAAIRTIDLPDGVPGSPGGKKPGSLIRERVQEGAIEQLFGNSLEYDFSPWYGKQDFVFIDAGHSYRNALADSKTALKLVEGQEAIILWHDYASMPGVTQAVEETCAQISSDVTTGWIEGTSLAFVVSRPGSPIRLK